MGSSLCVPSAGTPEELEQNDRINRILREAKKRESRVIKLLLLGPGESGKSTIAKQMKLIHQDGFKDEERIGYTAVICKNVISSVRALVKAADQLGMSLSEQQAERAQRVMKCEPDVITAQTGNDIKVLWADPVIRKVFARQSEFQLGDSAQYYLDNLDRIISPNYVPNDQDVLRSRAKTTGILVTEFEVEDVKFRMLDVGGQQSERRKWIHCFDDVTAVIFCCALSEYDLKLYEDATVNRMHESLKVFQEICSTKWLEKTDIILFLNKRDIFEEKIRRVDLAVTFPDYKGGKDYEKAKVYIKEQFLTRNARSDRSIYVHYTCATDTGNIAVVFNAVKDIILNKALETGGI